MDKKIVTLSTLAIVLLAVCVFFNHMQIDILRSENNALKIQISKLQDELNALKIGVETQRVELANLLSSLNASLTIDLTKINHMVKDILSENQQLGSKITNLEDRIEKLEMPTYTYIGSWRNKESFMVDFTPKTKFRVWWSFLGNSWDSWFSIWLAYPNGTLISCIAGGSGYYDFGMVELQAYEGSYSLIVYIEKGEAAIDLLVPRT